MKIVNENPGQVSLLCLAPLTNIALALKLEPTIASKINRVFIMGGTLHGKGNCKGVQEFNFKTDPEAAYLVFKHLPLVHLVPWEAAWDRVLSKKDYANLFDDKYPLCEFY